MYVWPYFQRVPFNQRIKDITKCVKYYAARIVEFFQSSFYLFYPHEKKNSQIFRIEWKITVLVCFNNVQPKNQEDNLVFMVLIKRTPKTFISCIINKLATMNLKMYPLERCTAHVLWWNVEQFFDSTTNKKIGPFHSKTDSLIFREYWAVRLNQRTVY